MNTDRIIKITSKLAMSAKCIYGALVIWLFLIISFGFAEDFQSRPTLSELNEMVKQAIVCGKAVRERELAVNRSQSFLPYCGVWQPYIISLQQELETLAPNYIDHENGPLTDAGDDFLYFTMDNWRAAAGLNASGFRRSTDGTTVLCGQMQSGDIIGPWVFEDLQNGLKALKWTITGGMYVYPAESRKSLTYVHFLYQEMEPGHPDWPTLAQVRAQFITAFEAQSWVGSSGDGGYKISAGDSAYPDWFQGWAFSAERVRSQQTLTFPTINRKVDHYVLTTGDGDFVDFDNTGLVEGKYTLYQSTPETSSTTIALDYIGNVNVCPITISTHGSIRSASYSSGSTPNFMKYVIKWQFTYGEE